MTPSRVGVIFGSRNTEHEVSIVTGLQVVGFLAGRHEVTQRFAAKGVARTVGKQMAE